MVSSFFTPGQPGIDWANPEIQAEFESILRFWFDRGIDGFRVDVAMMLAKDPTLADLKDADDMAEVMSTPSSTETVFMTFIDAGDRSRTHMLIGVSSSGRSGGRPRPPPPVCTS